MPPLQEYESKTWHIARWLVTRQRKGSSPLSQTLIYHHPKFKGFPVSARPALRVLHVPEVR